MTEEYREYLQSYEWEVKRENRLEIDEYECQKCGSTTNLHVHHLTYENIFEENMEDLLTLCADCHKEEHLIEEVKVIYFKLPEFEKYHLEHKAKYKYKFILDI